MQTMAAGLPGRSRRSQQREMRMTSRTLKAVLAVLGATLLAAGAQAQDTIKIGVKIGRASCWVRV